MTDIHQKKEIKKPNTVNPILAGIAGVVAGGVAVAAAVAMSDKKNQKKVKDALVGVKDNVTNYVDSIKSKPVIKKNLQKVEKVVNDTKKKIVEKV